MKTLAGGLALCLLFAGAPQSSSQGALTLSGTVRDGVTNRPMTGARVQLVAAEAGAIAVVATGDDGTFKFDNIKPGAYVVTAGKPPFAPVSRPVSVVNRAVADLAIALMPGAVIAGRVIDPFGQPAAGAYIEIRRTRAPGARFTEFASWLPMQADERGEYRLSGLAAGDYIVSARAATWMPSKVGSTDGPMAEPATVYFPDAVDLAQAELIRLAAGQERSGTDLQLRIAEQFAVAGAEVLGPEMQGRYASIRLRNYRLELADLSSQYFSADRSSSGFRFRAVPPGHYWLTAQAGPPQQWNNPDARAPREVAMWAATEVIVGDTDVSGLTLSYFPASSVSGRVTDALGSPLALGARLELTVVPMPGTPPVFYESWARGLPLNATGEFAIASAVPGRHQVRVRADGADLVVVSVTVGEVTTAGDVLDVSSGSMKGLVVRVRAAS